MRILIVEDSPTQAMRLQHLLKNADFESVTATSATAAVEMLEKDHRFDAILSDIDMPQTNGFELCRQVKQMAGACRIPFILLVSLKDANDVVQALSCGADNFLMKEYDKAYFLPQLINACQPSNTHHATSSENGGVHWDGQLLEIPASSDRLAVMLLSAFAMAVHQKAARQPVPSQV